MNSSECRWHQQWRLNKKRHARAGTAWKARSRHTQPRWTSHECRFIMHAFENTFVLEKGPLCCFLKRKGAWTSLPGPARLEPISESETLALAAFPRDFPAFSPINLGNSAFTSFMCIHGVPSGPSCRPAGAPFSRSMAVRSTAAVTPRLTDASDQVA